MIHKLLALIAPDYCYGCRVAGSVLCQGCKNNITSQAVRIQPGRLPGVAGVKLDIAFERTGVVAQLIDDYKFQRAAANCRPIAQLCDARLPDFPANAVLVPIPTTPHNIRQRGYDHMRQIARQLAKLRGVPMRPLLQRRNNITQHLTKEATARRRQAKTFFALQGKVDSAATYIILDDIMTTGATVTEAAKLLRRAGAAHIRVMIVARHSQAHYS